MKTLPNIHPGEVLLEEFLLPLGLQADHDLEEAHRALRGKLAGIERIAA